jgi:hypothetical protein
MLLLRLPRAWIGAGLAGLLGCGGLDEPEPGGTPPPGDTCPTGQVAAPAGGCMAVGLQGCAAELVVGGLCRPPLKSCPAGAMPTLDGCKPVGIPSCAPAFVAADGRCHPAPAACPAGTFPVPSEGCVPIDGPAGCGSAPWGAIPDAPGTVWVDPSVAGGDGTKQKPLATIAAALKIVPMGGTVALAAGNYDEAIYLSKPVQLVGRCASLVRLRGSTKDPLAVVSALNAKGIALRGVGIGGAGVGVAVTGAEVALERVEVRAATGFGVSVAGGSATLTHTLVADTKAPMGDPTEGKGIVALGGGSVTLVASAVLANHAAGMFASDAGTALQLTDSVVAGTLPSAADQTGGAGIVLDDGAKGTVERSALLGNHLAGVSAAAQATHLYLEGSVVAATLPQASDGRQGVGLTLSGGATAIVHATALVDNRYAGVLAYDLGSLSMDESLVARTTPDATSAVAGGVVVKSGIILLIQRSTLADNASFGVLTVGGGTKAIVTTTLVTGTSAPAAGTLGHGIASVDHAKLEVESVAVVGSSDAALFVGQDATLSVAESLLADGTGLADGSAGFGAACNGAQLSLAGTAVVHNQTAAVLAAACKLTVKDAFIDGVVPGRFTSVSPTATYDGISDGLVAGFGTTGTVTNLRVRGAARAGVVFDASSGTLAAVDADGGQFGLVAQGMPLPDWSDVHNRFRGGQQAILTDGALPVPKAPPAPQ